MLECSACTCSLLPSEEVNDVQQMTHREKCFNTWSHLTIISQSYTCIVIIAKVQKCVFKMSYFDHLILANGDGVILGFE
jgi:hypothetical protein